MPTFFNKKIIFYVNFLSIKLHRQLKKKFLKRIEDRERGKGRKKGYIHYVSSLKRGKEKKLKEEQKQNEKHKSKDKRQYKVIKQTIMRKHKKKENKHNPAT